MGEMRHLPNQFPDGTRYVIERRRGRILSRYLEFPDGRHVDLGVDHAGVERRSRNSRRVRKMGGRSALK